MAARKFYQINQYIQAKKVRVIDKDGKQIGIMTTIEALEEAKKQGLDLVEVAPKADPPVCKIIYFKKFIYQEKKKQSGRQGRKQSELKQIRLGLFIEGHDLERRINKAKNFLKNGHKVKFNTLFRGREITKKEFGFNLFRKIVDDLKEDAKVTQEPKLKGRILEMVLEPRNHGKN